MTFTPNIPQSGQSLGQTQALVNGNFTTLKAAIDQNHKEVGTANAGYHTIMNMPEQSTYPATAANETWMQTREFNSRSELAFRPESTVAGGDQFILTGMPIRAAGRIDATQGNGVINFVGRSFNVSGVKNSSTQYTITFTTQFPIGAATDEYIVIAYGFGSGGQANVGITSQSATSFVINVSSIGAGGIINFIVLGG